MSPLYSHHHTLRDPVSHSHTLYVPQDSPLVSIDVEQKGEEAASLFSLHLLQLYNGAPLAHMGPLLGVDHNSLRSCLPCLAPHPVLVFHGIAFLAKELYMATKVSLSAWECSS